jgi:FixJ family two-component response regulator
VFVTGSGDVPTVVEAMKHGAVDFLAKPIQEAQLVAAVTRGLDNVVRAEAQRHERDAFLERVDRLTARELQVAVCLIAGLSYKQIASELGMTEKTAKVHRSHIMEKLEVRSVAELVRVAEATRPSPLVPLTTDDVGTRI